MVTVLVGNFYIIFFSSLLQAQLMNGTNIPVVFGLLPNKETTTYIKFLAEVSNLTDNMFKG